MSNTPGVAILRDSGKRGLAADGKGVVADHLGECSPCCGFCSPAFLKAMEDRNPDYPPYPPAANDLTDMQGPGKGRPGARWRIWSSFLFFVHPELDPVRYKGCIDGTGTLVGLPDAYDSLNPAPAVSYVVFLEQGCLSEDETEIIWANAHNNPTPVFPC